nr:splicing factor [Tanacetum cinerariifolium]GEX70750.1 splicing factor [Tanacetum cinerariifolium]
GNVEEDPDGSQIDPHYKIKKGISYPKHDPTMDWNKMEPVLGMRFDHPEQLKICLANYGFANGYQLWYAKNDWKSMLVLYEVGHNKKTCDKDPVPKTPKPRKPPSRKSQTESVVYASSKGRRRGSRGGGKGARSTAKDGTDQLNTQESAIVHTASGVVEPPVGEGVHNASDVVEPIVAEGLDQEEIIDKVVIVEGVSVASNTRGGNKGKKVAIETAPALPFRIYHKNRGR